MKLYKISLLLLCASTMSSCVATTIVGGASAAGSAAFDERRIGTHVDDTVIVSKVDTRLMTEKDMPSRWVSVEVIEGEVILTGYLPSQEHIDRAILICKSVKGVENVRNELFIGEPSLTSIFSDGLITTSIKSKMLKDPIVSGFSIHIETVNGKVYLQGVIKTSEQAFRAKDIARNTDGVTAVVDLLRIRQ
ncbi:MAG: BON domain-containing protein [Mariprofundaceae bacterium]